MHIRSGPAKHFVFSNTRIISLVHCRLFHQTIIEHLFIAK